MIAIFPEIVSCAAAADLERLAVLVRLYFGGDETFAPVLETEQLLIGAGIEVQRLPLDYEGALLAKDERGAFRIVAVVRQGLTKIEERFLLAHLLGHYLLDIQPMIAGGELQVRGFRESFSPLQRYASRSRQAPGDREAEFDARADRFASCLVLPRALVKRAYAKMGAVKPTAQFFGVTLQCLQRRLEDTGVTVDQPANFLAAEDRLGPGAKAIANPPARLEAEDLVSPVGRKIINGTSGPDRLKSSGQSRTSPNSQVAVATYGGSFDERTRGQKIESRHRNTSGAQQQLREPARVASSASSDDSVSTRQLPKKSAGLARLRDLARQMDPGVD